MPFFLQDTHCRTAYFLTPPAQLAHVSCVDIGVWAAIAFENPAEYIGTFIPLVGDIFDGATLAATVSKLKGGAKYRWVPTLSFLPPLFSCLCLSHAP